MKRLSFFALVLAAVSAAAGPIRFVEIGQKAGARFTHHTHKFTGPSADVLGMFTSGGASAAVADFDGDGDEDLFLTDSDTGRSSRLLRNELVPSGKLAFTDVTAEAGVGGGNDAWSIVSDAVWLDADNDGLPDLLVARFGTPLLYRNEGKGKFRDVSAASGLHKFGNTIAALAFDSDNDGWQDLYLAGDYGTDRLFFNKKDGTFRDATKEAIGIDTRKGMNVDMADYDHDGWMDVYVTNITDEYMKECNMLWHNEGDGTFTDLSRETGTCNTLWGWAAKLGDFDDDGWEDLFVVNGLRSAGKENYIPVLLEMIITPGIDFTDVTKWPAIRDMSWSGFQKKKLFRNLGDQTFKEVAAEAGVDNDLDGRGIAVADFDNDGLLDLYQANANQISLLYRGTSSPHGHWIELHLVGTKSNRDAVGARVTVKAGGQTWLREVNGGNGYAGQSSKRLHVGLGAAAKIDALEVRWPSGRIERFTVPVDRITTLEEGKGAAK